MTVSITISETMGGVELADALVGDALAVGLDMGSVQNNSYSPLVDKSLNTGAADLYAYHDAAIDPITACKWYIQAYNTTVPWTYGGARSPALDIVALKALGDASGTSKNNADGLSGGIWIDQKWNATSVQQFDAAVSKVGIFTTAAGFSLATAINLLKESMVYSLGGTETAATSPVDGVIGKALDTVKGTNSHAKTRIYIPSSFAEGGYYQAEQVLAYSFTA